MSYPLLVLELELLLLSLVIVRIHPAVADRVRRFCASGRSWPWFSVAGLALLAHLLAWPVLRPALPGLPEEFANLLAADTFASGRWSNPAHPLRAHFEAPLISQTPVYGSTLPPGDGFVLALGQLAGTTISGAWIATALFCGALAWALAGWVPGSWALSGALLGILRLGIFSSWANTFQGGALAALAGCLVWGAAGRLRDGTKTMPIAAMVAGVILLFLSRPYEGMWLAAAAIAVLALHKRPMLQTIAPAALAFSAGMLLASSLGWLPPPDQSTSLTVKVGTLWMFFAGPALSVPLVAFAVAASRGRFARGLPALGALAVLTGVLIGPGTGSPAAWAPLTASLFVAVAEGCRWLMESRPRLAAACLLASALVVPARAAVWLGWLPIETYPPGKAVPWHASELNPLRRRAGVIRELRKLGGTHVVLVRYQPGHPPWEEYVYNGANIDTADVIWARELPQPLANAGLVQAYPDRRVWLWRVDETDVVEPHPLGSLRGLAPRR